MIPRCVKALVDVIQDLQLCANELINGTSLGPESHWEVVTVC